MERLYFFLLFFSLLDFVIVSNHLKWETKKQIGIWRNFSGISGMDVDKTGLGDVPAPFFIGRKIEIMKWEKFPETPQFNR